MSEYVIIVAGGKGLRMGGEVPKQFLPIGGVPVLMRTLMRFRQYSPAISIILVLPRDQQDYWTALCRQHRFPLPSQSDSYTLAEQNCSCTPPLLGQNCSFSPPLEGEGPGVGSYLLANGGATRFHSVLNGLALIPDDAQGVVGVHDGVRPFVSLSVISSCYAKARQTGAAIPVTPVVETLRHIPTQQNVLRSDYCLVQTPQVFDIQLLKAAYKRAQNQACLSSAEREQARPEDTAAYKRAAEREQAPAPTFTDDASVVEAYGHPVAMVDGNRENIKITTPFDLRVAELLL